MFQKIDTSIAVVGIDIGKNSFHVVGFDQRGAIVLRQKWSTKRPLTAEAPTLQSGLRMPSRREGANLPDAPGTPKT